MQLGNFGHASRKGQPRRDMGEQEAGRGREEGEVWGEYANTRHLLLLGQVFTPVCDLEVAEPE